MSEHTLDDLAARLAALGYRNGDLVPHDGSMCVSRFIQDDDGERTMVISAYRPRENWPSGGIYLVEHDEVTENSYRITATLTPNDIQALSLIRQWQASAEPAPPPAPEWVKELMAQPVTLRPSARRSFPEDMESPAAPVVTITQEMLEAGARRWAEDFDGCEWDELTEEDRENYLSDLDRILNSVFEAALRGADLAPEGARDGD